MLCVCVCCGGGYSCKISSQARKRKILQHSESPDLVITIWQEGRVWNELVKAMCYGGHIAENPSFILRSPVWAHAQTHTQMCIHTEERDFHLMVFSSQNFSIVGFSSPLFSSSALSSPPILEAGLCRRAEEASELVEESPQQPGMESCPQTSSHAWLLVFAQVKQYEGLLRSSISCDFEQHFLPRWAHTPGFCTLW